jgi:hypothetical protein
MTDLLMQPQTLEERIARGVELLNKTTFDKPWYQLIDLDKLNLRDNANCVLGQLYGTYMNALERLASRPDGSYDFVWGPDYGFSVTIYEPHPEEVLVELETMWRAEIFTLRENHVQ